MSILQVFKNETLAFVDILHQVMNKFKSVLGTCLTFSEVCLIDRFFYFTNETIIQSSLGGNQPRSLTLSKKALQSIT